MYSPNNTARVERIVMIVGVALVVLAGSVGAYLMGGVAHGAA